jgi:hypothetical protein
MVPAAARHGSMRTRPRKVYDPRSGQRLCRLLLLSAFVLPGCGTSLTVAQQKKELGTSDGGLPQDAGGPAIVLPDAVPEVVTICGHARCANRVATIPGADVEGFACCFNPGLSQCGIVSGLGSTCLETDHEGKLDPSCDMSPSSPLSSLPGCCRPDGKCGVFAPNLGLGCAAIPGWTELTNCVY